MREDNPVWKSWQIAKQRTLSESWKKENTREHWRAMMDECKSECAWMIESHKIEMAEKCVSEVMKLVGEILTGNKPASPAGGTTPPDAPKR